MALRGVHDDRGDEETREVSRDAAQQPRAGRGPWIPRGDLAAVDAALEERLPQLLALAPNELHPGQLPSADQGRQLRLVVVADPVARLDVIDARAERRLRPGRGRGGGRARGHDLYRDRRRARAHAGAAGQRGQLRRHLVGLREPALRILLQAARDQRFERGGDPRTQAAQGLGLPLDDRGQDLGRRVAAERGPARHHLVQDQAQRELIGAVIDAAPGGLLGRHVLERAQERPRAGPVPRERLAGLEVLQQRRGQDLGQTEVEDLQRPIRRDHQVFRLEVSVHDAGAMRLGQAVGELRAEVHHLGDREGPWTEPLPDGLALHQLHHHVVRALDARGLAHVVDVDDVRMVQGGGGARLAVEAVQQLGVRARTQDLDGHGPAQAGVARAVHLAHGPGSEAADHLVGADARAGRQGVCHHFAPGGSVPRGARPVAAWRPSSG